MSLTRVKVCCIMSAEEAVLAVAAGASAVGLVGAMPSGPGVIDDARIARIARRVPPPIATFLLTSRTSADTIAAHHRTVRTTTIQLVDAVPPGTYDALREALPGVSLVQVIHVVGEPSVDEALRIAPHVDALLLDSGNPALAVKELGGTGRRHDWRLSRRIVAESPGPVFLAGGLSADNVREVIHEVQPFGLDLCSGVRTDGRLDAEKLHAFFAEVRAA